MSSEVIRSGLAAEADFSIVRYAQCWEDADVLLDALDIHPGDVCLSIASAGDNTLSMLTRRPARIVAVDLSPAQLACLEIRVAAYRTLCHGEFLELMGVRPSRRRFELYRRLEKQLSPHSQSIWGANGQAIAGGICHAGRFERYLAVLRRCLLPLTQSRKTRRSLFERKTFAERNRFYTEKWDSMRWRLAAKIFLSRFVMGRLGRAPRFFKYVEGSVANPILRMIERALIELEPHDNPYLHWMVFGNYADALPHALRAENFETIREHIDRLEWRLLDVESCVAAQPAGSIDRFNLSDVFEYLSEAESARVMTAIARAGRAGGRLAYWNMLVPRHPPEALAGRLMPLPEISQEGHRAAKAFFYSAFQALEIR